MPKPQKEHEWLKKFLGEWTIEGGGESEPGQPPMTWKGTESVRSVGDFWVVGEGEGEMPEVGISTMITTMGYDPLKQRFVGSFIMSKFPTMWFYEGTLDAAGRVLTLDTEGPDMSEEGKTAKFQDSMEFVDDDHRILRSRMLGKDGQWREIMTAHFRRKK